MSLEMTLCCSLPLDDGGLDNLKICVCPCVSLCACNNCSVLPLSLPPVLNALFGLSVQGVPGAGGCTPVSLKSHLPLLSLLLLCPSSLCFTRHTCHSHSAFTCCLCSELLSLAPSRCFLLLRCVAVLLVIVSPPPFHLYSLSSLWSE